MISLIAVAMLFAASPIPQTPVRGIVSVTSPQPDLVWYKLNEGSDTNITDYSTAGTRSGWVNNSGIWATVGGYTCIQGNGSSYYMRTSNNITFGVGVITVTFWLYNASYDAAGIAELTANFNGTSDSFRIATTAVPKINAAMFHTPGYRQEDATPGSTSNWHNYAIVLDNNAGGGVGNVKIYIDSVAAAENITLNSKTVGGNFATDIIYFLARGGSSIFSTSALDDVRVYGSELSQSQIDQVYADRQ